MVDHAPAHSVGLPRWLLASRGQLDEDAVIFAVTDRVSLLICLTIAVIAAFATV